MSGPPNDVAPSLLYAALTKMPTPHEVVDYPVNLPGTDYSVGQIAFVPLSQEDVMQCHATADEYARKVLKTPPKAGEENRAYDSIFGHEAAVQILWRAMRAPEDPTLERRSFPAPKMVRMLMPDVLGVLMTMYVTAVAKIGPIVSTMSKEELDAWIERLVEGGSAFPLALLSSEMLRDLVMRLVDRIKASPTGNASVGSPLAASPSAVPEEAPPTPAESDEPAPLDVDDVTTTPDV